MSTYEEQAGPLLLESSIHGFCMSMFYLKVLAVQVVGSQIRLFKQQLPSVAEGDELPAQRLFLEKPLSM